MIHFYLNSCRQGHLHRNCYTGVATQGLGQLPGDQIVSGLLQNQTSPVLLFLSGGRDSQAVAFETLPSAACRTPKCVAKCGSCLSLGNPLRRWRVPDGQTCGVVTCETSFPQQPSAEIVRFEPKHVVKCKFGEARRSPFARNEGQPSKTCVKL